MASHRTIRLVQFAVGALAATAIAFTVMPHPEETPGSIRPAGHRLPMPDFTMADLQGAQWNLAAHRGRVVLVNFWATWCPPCREEIPDLIRLSQSDRSLEIAGIAMDEGNSAGVRQFVKAAGLPFPILLPAGSTALTQLIQALPTTFLIDKQGMVARQYIGAVNEKTVRQDVERLQAED